MMKDLLNLSIEELEHILAVAPYSEIHQMAYSIKKNELGKGAMHQIDEGSFYNMYMNQQELTKALIHSDESVIISTKTGTEISRDVNIETAANVSSDQEKKAKKKKKKIKGKKKKKIKALPAEIKKKTKKEKKKKRVEGSDIKKKTKKKVKGKKSGKSMDLQLESTSGLSDFSTWLLSQSSSSQIHSLSNEKKKIKGKKKKKKLKKDQSVVSEPLADLLAAQGHTLQAIAMYQKLSLIFPEKSAFFAAEIEKIQNQK